ncbi:MAG: ImmA/IrrE family metallo-endopeptidase, partial [Pseudomonadota bacterium]
MPRVAVPPALFAWARERAGLDGTALAARFPHLDDWETGARQPTLRQLEQYAQATHAPVGYFFLPAPPQESLPIPDFRTLGLGVPRVSANLLDVVYACQSRQAWYRDEALVNGETPLPFIGSVRLQSEPPAVAERIRRALGFSVIERAACPTWAEALRLFIAQAEAAGVMVMVSGVVMNNNARHLDVREFRGFALADPLAPLVFINGADSKAAQMFTLVHELCHLWLGQSAVSDGDPTTNVATERFCNAVAAETLAPASEFRAAWDPAFPLPELTARLARLFKVSTLVVLIRAREAGLLADDVFEAVYAAERDRVGEIDARGGGDGGDFYNTQNARLGGRFAAAVISSALEGRTPYTEA